MNIFRTYVSDAALLVAPSIPPAKLANASTSCLLPKGEKVLALIDCTVFGSASDCILFGTRGLYYHNSAGANPNPAFIPYDDFPRCSFVKYWVWCVTVEGEKYFNISGSNANRGRLIEMLHEMKRMIADRPVPEVEPVPLDEDEEPDGFVGALSEVVNKEAWSRKGSGLGGWEAKLPERVVAILRNYQGQSGFHVYPNIPEKKLVNAMSGCSVPAQEKMLGLIDCTVFGSASDAVVFGQKGIYYHNMGGNVPDPGVLLYRDFPECTFENYWLNCVSFGGGRYLNKAGSNFSRDNIVAILSAIRDVVIDLRD
jgi:hypothetical protein